ncbi:MAG: hypothetical protein H0X63_05815 [Flavobacteriales bacterium]|nr:hypothetical protein [Flavobacteriales bacterium]
MKNNVIKSLIVLFSLSLISSACSNDDNGVNNTDVSQLVDIAQDGTWRITSYIDSGQDETSDFTGFNFSFNTNGNLSAINGDIEINGTWSITNDDDGNSGDDIDFNIFFAAPPNFEDLTDDWDIVSMTNTRIELIDISGGNGGTDNLVFTKN